MSTDESRPYVHRVRRAVVAGDGRIFASVTDAAVAYDVGPPSIWTKCRLQRDGFRFLDEAPRPPVARSSRRKA
jgi:hypothetical protein